MSLSVQQKYDEKYKNIRFERTQLFKLLAEEYGPKYILYPGCSTHITPSIFFSHVLYIDKSEEAAEYFNKLPEIIIMVRRNKQYKQQPNIEFINKDYETVQLRDTYDLLLSLYSPNIIKSCCRFVKKDGLVLTHNFQNEAQLLQRADDWKIKSLIRYEKGRYKIIDRKQFKIENRNSDKRYLKNSSTGVEYIEGEIYYVFQKTK
ncbi:MAG: hypothetical protein A2V66_17565 [Ignavibacteria bacterium RBG_13_36_8]|nr:MAG: hypothetical protein A2V66_17565 [Ignavibacteria bacterium RBG_13_36_8]